MKGLFTKAVTAVLAASLLLTTVPTENVFAKPKQKKIELGAIKMPTSGIAEYKAPDPAKKLTKKEADEKNKLMAEYKKGRTILKNDADFYYYYSILDPTAKEIYDVIYDVACDPVDPGNIGLMITDIDPNSIEFEEALGRAYRAICFDHPELFWLYSGMADIYQSWTQEPGSGVYYFYLQMAQPFEEFEDMETKFNEAAEEFLKDIDKDASDYEIIREVHDKLINLVNYNDPVEASNDRNSDLAHTAYGSLVEDSLGNKNYPVCDGYTLALEYLLQQCGIDVAFIGGVVYPDSSRPGGHAWNVVRIGNAWYEVDSTWDDFGNQLDNIDDKATYDFYLSVLQEEEYKEIYEHPYFMISTDKICHFNPGNDYDYIFPDGSSWAFFEESERVRLGEDGYDFAGYYDADIDLIRQAPVAEGDYDDAVHSDKTSKDDTKTDNRKKFEDIDPNDYEIGESGLPVYVVESFVEKVLKEETMVEVPEDWGNNDTGRSRTSYSPVNDSGAISPLAGTLTLSYFDQETMDAEAAFDEYQKNLASMSIIHNLTSEEYEEFDAPARKINYIMNIGANVFACTSVCFSYEGTIYVIEILQGNQSIFDFLPMYEGIVESTNLGDMKADKKSNDSKKETVKEDDNKKEEKITETVKEESKEDIEEIKEEIKDEPDETEEVKEEKKDKKDKKEKKNIKDKNKEEKQEEEIVEAEEEIEDETEDDNDVIEDGFESIGDFVFKLNGHIYEFPTQISDIDEDDLPLDYTLVIPYDFESDDDLIDGKWTEIINTQYLYFDDSLYMEMAGITNLEGEDADITDCVLTALVDTQGNNVEIELPGGVKVGAKEKKILKGFPKFKKMEMDGVAKFVKNDLLYACNVRDDGCNGYVIIKNNAPFYSAVSIICEDGIIKEISYECLGKERAKGVFLD